MAFLWLRETGRHFVCFYSIPYCDIDLVPYEYDLTLAGQILDEAGWKMGSGNIRERKGKTVKYRPALQQ